MYKFHPSYTYGFTRDIQYCYIMCSLYCFIFFIENNKFDMGDRLVTYTPGVMVWVKFYRVWWPGKVILASEVPNELQHFLAKIKNCIAIVHFSGHNS